MFAATLHTGALVNQLRQRPSMTMWPASMRKASSSIVPPATLAGTITQASRGLVSFSEPALPCEMIRPRTLSTWLDLPMKPSVIEKSDLVCRMIQALRVAAGDGAASIKSNKLCFIHADGRMNFLLCLGQAFWSV